MRQRKLYHQWGLQMLQPMAINFLHAAKRISITPNLQPATLKVRWLTELFVLAFSLRVVLLDFNLLPIGKGYIEAFTEPA